MLAAMRVQLRGQCQCNNGDDVITATVPAKQWRRRQRNKGNNASGTLAKTPGVMVG